jgi:hypothetical protein
VGEKSIEKGNDLKNSDVRNAAKIEVEGGNPSWRALAFTIIGATTQ